jgi:rhamnose utilization protein RhaD (predicted bifunctional aldolase and dehydrogenase)
MEKINVSMENAEELYLDLCKRVGSLSEWVQGAGGNISVKSDNHVLIKASGTRIADGEHLVFDRNTREVIKGSGKPSIETFFHFFDAKIIVHLHPAPLFNLLCGPPQEIPGVVWINYYKPGEQLAAALEKVYCSSKKNYFFQNHGIMICGETIFEIMEHMVSINERFFPKNSKIAFSFVNMLYEFVKGRFGKQMCIKSFSIPKVSQFIPFTPDLCVFLQKKPLFYTSYDSLEKYVKENDGLPSVVYFEEKAYVMGKTLMDCYDMIEILNSYFLIEKGKKYLTDSETAELINWDQEKLRIAMRQ